MAENVRILALNAGSSSLKFALFEGGRRVLNGKADRVDRAGDAAAAAGRLLEWIDKQGASGRVDAIGHRCVFGGPGRHLPEWLSGELVDELRAYSDQDPEHMPHALAVMEEALERHPERPQYVCFDTAFHATLPRLARLFPLPRDLAQEGVMRYGFHGLSCESVLEEVAGLTAPDPVPGRIVIAHLGGGCSLTAVRNGRSVDTSMGFSPAGGIMMGTRSGDLDPGVLLYLLRKRRMSPSALSELVNRRSGLAGVSGLGGDMRDLAAAERTSPAAAEAVALFCYQCRKGIGAMAAVLGGLDELIFTGGIGEHHPAVRARICEGLLHLGVELDADLNRAGEGTISGTGSAARVRVLKAREEWRIARHGEALLREREGVPA